MLVLSLNAQMQCLNASEAFEIAGPLISTSPTASANLRVSANHQVAEGDEVMPGIGWPETQLHRFKLYTLSQIPQAPQCSARGRSSAFQLPRAILAVRTETFSRTRKGLVHEFLATDHHSVAPGDYTDVVDLVVPELQRRGRYRTAYAPGTFREKIYGAGQPWLRDDHPGAAYRKQPELAERRCEATNVSNG